MRQFDANGDDFEKVACTFAVLPDDRKKFDWSQKLVHIARGNRTICGRRIGVEGHNWQRESSFTQVTCGKCRGVLNSKSGPGLAQPLQFS